MDEQLRNSPFGVLLDIPGVKAQDIFGNVSPSDSTQNAFSMGTTSGNTADLAYGGNPFAGDNFWNLFAGGVNPSNPVSNNGNSGYGF